MKKIIIVLSFVLLHNYICLAQPGREGGRIEAIKVAFFTEQLNLTSEEAQKFWPLYNTYFAELKKARNENKADELVFEEKALAIRKRYKTEFQKVLVSDERVNKVYALDKHFREMLRKEL